MSVSKKNKRRAKSAVRAAPRAFGGGESRAAEFLTVGWLLTTFTTLLCELGGVAATWLAQRNPQALGIAALASVLVFAALLTGLFSLALLAGVWKLRIVKPPRGIAAFAIVVSVAPALVVILKWVMDRSG